MNVDVCPALEDNVMSGCAFKIHDSMPAKVSAEKNRNKTWYIFIYINTFIFREIERESNAVKK